MSISWLRLRSGTVNQAVSCREGLACCKTKACIYIKGLCWADPAVGAASREQCECPFPRNSLSLWNPTQVKEQSWAEKSSDHLRLPVNEMLYCCLKHDKTFLLFLVTAALDGVQHAGTVCEYWEYSLP